MLDVQFWLMGRDVEHPAGNLLTRLGFTRQADSDRAGPSRYQRIEAGGNVLIWRCGMLLQTGEHDCLLLRGMAPAVVTDTRVDDLYDPAEVRLTRQRGEPCPPPALAQASRWFAAYESSVEATAGIGHRIPRPGTAPALAPPKPCSLERAWRALAHRLVDTCSSSRSV